MEVVQPLTSTVLSIPQEIVDQIVELLLVTEPPPVSKRTSRLPPTLVDSQFQNLDAISTVCRAFVGPIQRYLFAVRHLDASTDYALYNDFLSRKLHIATYTRTLTLVLHEFDQSSRFALTPSQSLAFVAVLQKFTSVQDLTIGDKTTNYEVSWLAIKSNIRLSILQMSRLPTIKSLRLAAINNFCLTDFKPASHGQTLILLHVTGMEDTTEISSLKETTNPAEHAIGYSALVVDRLDVKLREQVVRTYSSSLTRLEILDLKVSYVDLSGLASLLSLKLRVWHTDTRGGETGLSAILRSVGTSSNIREIDCTILIFHPTALRGACTGVDTILSGPKYRRLSRFNLHVTCLPFSESTILQSTGYKTLEDYYRHQLSNLASRRVLFLQVTMPVHR